MPSRHEQPRDIDIPPSWQRSAAAILAHRWRKVLIIGAADCGKTTYSNFLTTSLRAAGAAVAFVDGDVGQKDVGPPATISLAQLDGEGELARARPVRLYFVGDVDPVGHLLPMVVGTRRMVDAAGGDFVVADTPGLIEGAGRALNAYQIESLQPDVIVAIERARELRPTLHPYRHRRIVRLRPSRKAATKSDSARRRARERAFRGYFADGREVDLDLRRLRVQRARLFVGEPFEDPRFLYAERTPEGVVAIGEAAAPAERRWRVLPPDFADHLLCGVTDAQGECCGLGIIGRIELPLRRLRLFTPVPPGQVRGLQFGDLYLGRDGRELGRKRTDLF
jgi:polynucleotide 5'-hydroxyl-kinase GRC3/NOL9